MVRAISLPHAFLSDEQKDILAAIDEKWNSVSIEGDRTISELKARLDRSERPALKPRRRLSRPRKPGPLTLQQTAEEVALHLRGFNATEIQQKLYPFLKGEHVSKTRQAIRKRISRAQRTLKAHSYEVTLTN